MDPEAAEGGRRILEIALKFWILSPEGAKDLRNSSENLDPEAAEGSRRILEVPSTLQLNL